MQITRDTKKKLKCMLLCDVPVGFIFKFKNIRTPMLRLGEDCGYVELGGAWESVEQLDGSIIDDSTEEVTVYGKLKSITVVG